MDHTRLRWSLFAAALAVVATTAFGLGCGPSEKDDTTTSRQGLQCTRSKKLLKERHTCRRDAQCPCGSHCQRGLCAYDCLKDADCEGDETCSKLGTCRSPGAGPSTDDSPAAQAGIVETYTDVVQLVGSDDRVQVPVRRDGTLDEPIFRIAPESPLEVSCDGGNSWSKQDCRLTDPAEENWETILVRAPDQTAFTGETSGAAIQIFGGPSVATVDVRLVEPDESSAGGGPSTAPPGVYGGNMRLQAAGFASRSADPTPDPLADMTLPIRAEIHADDDGSKVVRLEDTIGLMFDGEKTVGRLESSGDQRPTLEMPRRPFITASKTPFAQTTAGRGVRTHLKVTGQVLEQDAESIQMSVRTTLHGLAPKARAPYLQWQMTLEKLAGESELDAAPTVPDPSELKQPVGSEAERLAYATRMIGKAGELKTGHSWPPFICTPVTDDKTKVIQPDPSPKNIVEVSGDLACKKGGAPPTFPAIHEIDDGKPLAARDRLSACADAMTKAAGDSPFGRPDCAALGRTVATIDAAIGRRQELDRDGPKALRHRAATLVAHRHLQQWLQLDSHVGDQYRGLKQRQRALAKDETLPLEPRQTIARSNQMWDLFLQPRIAGYLTTLGSERLARPDYREAAARVLGADSPEFPDDKRSYDQDVGLPVTLFDTVESRLKHLGTILRNARLGPLELDAVKEPSQASLRRAVVLATLAEGLYRKANLQESLTWKATYQRSRRLAFSRLGGMVAVFQDIAQEANPLGVQPDEVPLYRVGDETSPQKRFFAVSDYLLGEGAGTSSIVTTFYERARRARDAARQAWKDNVQLNYQKQVSQNARERRLEAIREKYGSHVVSLCGLEMSNQQVLDNADKIDPENCFFNSDKEGCNLEDAREEARTDNDPPPQSAGAAETDDAISPKGPLINICMLQRYQGVRAGGLIPYPAPKYQLPERLDISPDPSDDHQGVYLEDLDQFRGTIQSIESDADRYKLTIDSEQLDDQITMEFAPGRLKNLTEKTWTDAFGKPEKTSPDQTGEDESGKNQQQGGMIRQNLKECTSLINKRAKTVRPVSAGGGCQTNADCPRGTVCKDGGCAGRSAQVASNDPACYRGQLGEQFLKVSSMATAVEQAKSEYEDHFEGYDLAVESCLEQLKGNQKRQAAIESHNQTMQKLRIAKTAAQAVAHATEAASACFGAFADATSPWDKGFAGTVCGLEAVAAGAEITADALEAEMQRAEDAHKLTVDKIDSNTQIKRCFTDAKQELVGAKTALEEIKQAKKEFTRVRTEFQNMKSTVSGALSNGAAALKREQNRTASPIQTDFWLDAKVDGFSDRIRVAKRAAYLAAQAVEYEYQMTLAAKQSILTARYVKDLEGALQQVRNVALTGRVDGGSPDELLNVVSMRDAILQMADRSNFGDGWKQLSKAERFRRVLQSDQYAVYDDEGNYKGQRIPFDLAPLGNLEYADDNGVGLLAGTDCAERVWSVNASLQGEDLYRGSETTFTRVVLEKSNSFYSQWCDGASNHEEPFQRASVRPGRNLFVSPSAAGASAIESVNALETDSAGGNSMTSARISAYFNISQAELEQESYFNGDSTELAGRGLYGRYALFIPAQTISNDPKSNGLVLGNIEDVLLRFDYVSVAK